MKNLFISVLVCVSAISYAQESGGISVAFAYANFLDHKIQGGGMSVSYHSPYLLKKERIFLVLNGTIGLGEGNRNFEFDPNKNYSLANTHAGNNIVTGPYHRGDNAWFNETLRTSKSTQMSVDLLVAQSFELNSKKHRLVVGLGVYYATISQQYVIDNIDMKVTMPALGIDDEVEIQYVVPFQQKYRTWGGLVNLQYHYQIGQQLYLKSDLRYYYQKAPFVGSLFLGLGVGVNI